MDEIYVYVQYDQHNSIINIRSSVFLSDTEGWTKVDEWKEGEDRYLYSHCDNGEYVKQKHGKPLYDELGQPNFHDDFVEWSEQEKDEIYNFKLSLKKAQQESNLHNMMTQMQRTTFLVELPDEEAVKVALCYPEWESGKSYSVGDRVQCDEKLWKCRQAHTSQDNWRLSIDTASLWEAIDETHEGTLEDPIPYDQTMEVYSGKYYIEDGIIYQCIRDSVNPLYASCASLVDNYFKVAKEN